MEQFTQSFLAFRDRMEAALPKEFRERERGVLIAGRGCALAAGYSLSQERKMFGIVGTGSHTHCHELRLLYSVPGLQKEQLADCGHMRRMFCGSASSLTVRMNFRYSPCYWLLTE